MRSKKILVVTPRYPFPVTGGDKLRISEIIKFLSKKNKIDLISIGKNKKNINFVKKQFIFKNNIFAQSFNVLKSYINDEPLQIGLYKVPKMKEKIEKISKNYDVIIFHLIRSAYYVPDSFRGKKILEMTDLISENYKTVEKNLSSINPLKYLYKFERKKLIKFEIKQAAKFNNLVIVNKNDVKNSNIPKNKLSIIGNGTHIQKNIYSKNNKKNNIIFFGNINSLANRSACLDLINDYLPTLNKDFSKLKLKIVGNCSNILKIFFWFKGINVVSNIDFLKNYCENSLAGICNVKIHSGLQNKILDYTSIGLPIIINKASNNFQFLKGKNILQFENKKQFFAHIKKLNSDDYFRKYCSSTNYKKTIRYYKWNKILKNYSKLLK